MSTPLANRFSVELQTGSNPEQSISRLIEQVIKLTQQLNQANVPIVIGPFDNIPIGLKIGQPVIDWSSGTTQLKVWNGDALI